MVFRSSLVVILLCWMGSAQASCLARVPADFMSLLQEGDFQRAEKIAQQRLAATHSLSAYYQLSNTYLAQAFQLAKAPQSKSEKKTNSSGADVSESAINDSADVSASNEETPAQNIWMVTAEYVVKAESVLLEIQERWPQDREINFCILEFYRQASNVPALAEQITLIAKIFKKKEPEIVRDLIRYGDFYAGRNQLDEAIMIYQQLVEQFPNDLALLFNLASALQTSGQLNASNYFLQHAHKVAPDNQRISVKLVEQAIWRGDLQQLEVMLRKVLDGDLSRTPYYFDLAILSMTRDLKGSLSDWKKYLKWHDAYPDTEVRVAFAAAIVERLEAGVDIESLDGLALQLYQSEMIADSMILFQYLVENDLDNPEPAYSLAKIYQRLGFIDYAYQYLLYSVQAFAQSDIAEDDAARLNLYEEAGRLAYGLTRYDESLGFYRQVEQLNPEWENLQYMLGLLHSVRGEVGLAEGYFKDCLKQPNNSQYYNQCEENLKDPQLNS